MSKATKPEAPRPWLGRVGSLSADWWATLAAGVIATLAVAEALPRIPW